MDDNTDQRKQRSAGASATERRQIGFLIAKVAIFALLPLLAAAIAVYIMLYP